MVSDAFFKYQESDRHSPELSQNNLCTNLLYLKSRFPAFLKHRARPFFFILDVQMVIGLKSIQNPMTISLSELQYSFSVHTASCKEKHFPAKPFKPTAEGSTIWVSLWWLRCLACMDHTTFIHMKASMSAWTHVCTFTTQMYLPLLPTPSIQAPAIRQAKNQ